MFKRQRDNFKIKAIEKSNFKNSYDAGADEDGNVELNDKLLKKFSEKTYQVIQRVQEIGLPKRGWQLRLITTKAFNAIAIIKLIAEAEIIREAKLVIFAINIQAAQTLIELKQRHLLQDTTLIISSIRNAGIKDKSKAVTLLQSHFEIIFITSHAKIAVLKTAQGNYYSIEGSGNLSFNARLEQYIIDNDQGLWNFSNEWINEIQKMKKRHD